MNKLNLVRERKGEECEERRETGEKEKRLTKKNQKKE